MGTPYVLHVPHSMLQQICYAIRSIGYRSWVSKNGMFLHMLCCEGGAEGEREVPTISVHDSAMIVRARDLLGQRTKKTAP